MCFAAHPAICAATVFAFSDYANEGPIEGQYKDQIIITCIDGYTGGGLSFSLVLVLSLYIWMCVNTVVYKYSLVIKYVLMYVLIGTVDCLSNGTWSFAPCVATSDIPRPLAARLSDSGSRISLHFDVPTDMSITSCTALLNAESVDLLGSAAVCAWTDGLTLLLYL